MRLYMKPTLEMIELRPEEQMAKCYLIYKNKKKVKVRGRKCIKGDIRWKGNHD